MWRLWLMIGFLILLAPQAGAENRYASIIVDSDTLEIIHARQIDEPRFPASLTKVMTLMLVFDKIAKGELTLDQELVVSAKAARTPPVKMGLRTGQRVRVDTLIQAVAVRSSNDAAVVLAEAISGSEAAFAEAMTARARSLSMMRTTFMTANGLPHPEQKTTARDMVKLAQAVLDTHPQHYHYFGQTHFRGKRNTNGLLVSREDVDGFKTGYTRDSGYNLMVSARRDGRRLIAVVLGGASGDSRNRHMNDLIDRGFKVMSRTPAPMKIIEEPIPAPASNAPTFVTLRGSDAQTRTIRTSGVGQSAQSWQIELRDFSTAIDAQQAAKAVRAKLNQGTLVAASGFVDGRVVHHARLSGLNAAQAIQACQTTARHCRIIAP